MFNVFSTTKVGLSHFLLNSISFNAKIKQNILVCRYLCQIAQAQRVSNNLRHQINATMHLFQVDE